MKFSYLLLFILLSSSINAQYVVSIDDVDYDETTCSISNYKWPKDGRERIIIPNHFGDKRIKTIGIGCFINPLFLSDENSGLKAVSIENGIEHIEHSAFLYNRITELNLGEGIESIGDYCFGSSLLSIRNLVLPDSITSIGYCAFAGCGITSISLPDNIKTIGKRAFEGNLLTQLIVPSGIRMIDEDAFHSNHINKLIVKGNVEYLSGFRDNEIDELSIPGTVRIIGKNAFSDNPLTSVCIENGVSEIGDWAFASSIRDIDDLETISRLLSIDIPSSVTKIGTGAFAHNHNLNRVLFSEGLIEINSRAFLHCALSDVSFPSSLTSIGNGAFSINQLLQVNFNEGLVNIDDNAFKQNPISNTVLPNSLMKVGAGAFYGSLIDRIHLPSSDGTKVWDMFDGESILSSNVTDIRGNVDNYSYKARIANDVDPKDPPIPPKPIMGTSAIVFRRVVSDDFVGIEYLAEDNSLYVRVDGVRVYSVEIPGKPWKRVPMPLGEHTLDFGSIYSGIKIILQNTLDTQ
ncbi:MAG: leucine-rich repeat domain-containing protein [Marinilabiliaceae bacterium]|nr:leucine-rich repeat domain-containing protein [Marinilabiliaceae bacterium]